MPELKTPLDILKVLPQTNCRDCGAPTCMVFAVAVSQGKRPLDDCPHLDPEVAASASVASKEAPKMMDDIMAALGPLREKIKTLDLEPLARPLGARYKDGKLFINCLGRDFSVDQEGQVYSGCHINGWVAPPVLNYVINGGGPDPKGQWVPLRDLPGGKDWGRFFEHQCEKRLWKIIDDYTELMEDLVDVFGGKPAPEMFDSDIAVVIYPLPKLPMLLCYWKPEDGMASSLNVFFDVTAEDNLPIGSIYSLATGLAVMFEKVSQTHGK
ncbi:MAG: DUF3786 domain-containing protein [Desulfarculaceae bacterium]|nr:DUF3786 domain-containing protein [Desulfarculaceae bacterium]